MLCIYLFHACLSLGAHAFGTGKFRRTSPCSQLRVKHRADLGEDPILIPRSTLFGNPQFDSPQISPDGHHILFTGPSKHPKSLGTLNAFVVPIGTHDDDVNDSPQISTHINGDERILHTLQAQEVRTP